MGSLHYSEKAQFRRLTIALISCICIFAPLLGTSVSVGARLANSYEKTFTLSGSVALESARILGFADDFPGALSFPLPADDWICTPLNCGPRGNRSNSVEWKPHDNQRLTIHGQWTDSETGSMEKVPRYVFSSPKIPADAFGEDAWGKILSRIHPKPDVKSATSVKITEISTAESGAPYLTLRVYSEDFGHVFRVQIGCDERNAEARKHRQNEYKECQKQITEKQLDGGC